MIHKAAFRGGSAAGGSAAGGSASSLFVYVLDEIFQKVSACYFDMPNPAAMQRSGKREEPL